MRDSNISSYLYKRVGEKLFYLNNVGFELYIESFLK